MASAAWIDDSDDGPAFHQAPSRLSKTPQIVLLALSVAGLLVAAFRNPLWSAIAYIVVLLVGSATLYFDRVRVITATRSGSSAAMIITKLDQLAVLLLFAACLANGIVIAMEVASR